MSLSRNLHALAVVGTCLVAASNCTSGSRDEHLTVRIAYGTGYAVEGVGAAEQYRTRVLELSDSAVRMIREDSDVVISATERMRVITECSYDSATKTNNYRQRIVRVPLSASNEQREPMICAGEPRVSGSTRTEPMDCDDWRARIVFVSAHIWAEEITAQQTSDCEPRGGRFETTNTVYRLDSSDTVRLTDIFDSATVSAAYTSAMQRGSEDLKRDGMNCPAPSETNMSNWGIAHRNGQWTPIAIVKEFAIYGECQFSSPIQLSLPDALVDDAPASNAPAAPTLPPNLSDYLVSPSGVRLIGLNGDRDPSKMIVFRRNARGYRVVGELPWSPRYSLVMVKWRTAPLPK